MSSAALRDFAFKLKPLSLSTDLITQLKACAVKLDGEAENLQKKIQQKANKNKHYAEIITRVWGCPKNMQRICGFVFCIGSRHSEARQTVYHFRWTTSGRWPRRGLSLGRP